MSCILKLFSSQLPGYKFLLSATPYNLIIVQVSSTLGVLLTHSPCIWRHSFYYNVFHVSLTFSTSVLYTFIEQLVQSSCYLRRIVFILALHCCQTLPDCCVAITLQPPFLAFLSIYIIFSLFMILLTNLRFYPTFLSDFNINFKYPTNLCISFENQKHLPNDSFLALLETVRQPLCLPPSF